MKRLDCDVVVLCGGRGTRLRSMLDDRPKPMVLVGDRPFLDILVDYLVEQGCRRIIFCTGFKSEWISSYVMQDARFECVCSVEPRPLGTAGALKQCRASIRTSTVLVCNGDSVCHLDVGRLLDEHRRSGCSVTIALVPSDGRTDGGGVSLDANGRLVSFNEKGRPQPYLNAGIYAFETEVLDTIPSQSPCSLEQDVFPYLVPRGIHGYVTDGTVDDIGTPERLTAFRVNYEASRKEYTYPIQGGQE